MKKNKLYLKLLKRLRGELSPQRFQHSVNVGTLAAALGKKHGWSPERARLAGLLHDCAKEWSPKKLKKYASKRKLKIPDMKLIVERFPNMLHAYVGADVVRRKKWITRSRDLRAIASHTLGRVPMGLEDKILYIADFAAHGRLYRSAARIRKQALADLDAAFREAVSLKIFWQLKKNKPIHPLPVRMWNKVVCRVGQ